jgi:hypothetical protein
MSGSHLKPDQVFLAFSEFAVVAFADDENGVKSD